MGCRPHVQASGERKGRTPVPELAGTLDYTQCGGRAGLGGLCPEWGIPGVQPSNSAEERRLGEGRDVSPECQAWGQSGCKEEVRSHFQSQIHTASAESLCSCIWGHQGWGGESRWSRGREALCLSSRQGVEGTRALTQDHMRARGQCWPPLWAPGKSLRGRGEPWAVELGVRWCRHRREQIGLPHVSPPCWSPQPCGLDRSILPSAGISLEGPCHLDLTRWLRKNRGA